MKGFGEEKSTGGNKKTRQRRWRTQDKEGLKAIETRSRNSRTDESRMTSGTTNEVEKRGGRQRRESRRMTKKGKPDGIRHNGHRSFGTRRNSAES